MLLSSNKLPDLMQSFSDQLHFSLQLKLNFLFLTVDMTPYLKHSFQYRRQNMVIQKTQKRSDLKIHKSDVTSCFGKSHLKIISITQRWQIILQSTTLGPKSMNSTTQYTTYHFGFHGYPQLLI